MKKSVLIPFKIPLSGFDQLTSDFELLVPEESIPFNEVIYKYLKGCDVLVSVFNQKITSDVIDSAPNLKLIANYGVGYDNVDVEYATKKGVVVTNTPDPVTEPTAELAFSLMSAAARNIPALNNGIVDGTIMNWGVMDNLSSTLLDKTLGIIGMGAIGKAVARRAKASGMNIIYYNRNRLSEEIEREYGAGYSDFETLLRESDYVSLHVPHTQQTHRMIGKDALNMMKPSATLINTARGKVVDEKALIEALKSNKIAMAALDVFYNEPHVSDDLKKLRNVVMTPHVGTATHDGREDMTRFVAMVIKAFFSGSSNIPVVNPEVFKK
ncbi:NAD(P)-dependent oxidoreductase [Marinilabiliaceae bacterium ANBcel2]|nr:NAD(P)-dependent oxidoreductase [Marinilabiliaceae bacterium ANBcel2]